MKSAGTCSLHNPSDQKIKLSVTGKKRRSLSPQHRSRALPVRST